MSGFKLNQQSKEKHQQYQAKKQEEDYECCIITQKIQQQVAINCTVCESVANKSQAKYINIKQFIKPNFRYLCEKCAKNKQFLISLNPKVQTTFSINLKRNSKLLGAKKRKEMMTKLFNQKIDKPIQKLIENVQKSYQNIKNQLVAQFKLFSGIFSMDTIPNFIQKIKKVQKYKKQKDKLQIIQFATGLENIYNKQIYKKTEHIIQATQKSYTNIHALIKTELSDFEARFMNVRQRLQKSNITKILKQSKNFFSNQIQNQGLIAEHENQMASELIECQSQSDQIQIIHDENSTKSIWQKVSQTQYKISYFNQQSKLFSKNPQSISSFDKIQKVIIQYEKNIEKCLGYLGRCPNLKQIYIEQPLLSKKQIVLFLINSFSDLKVLNFSCNAEIDEKCIDALLKQHPNLQYFSYGCNLFKNMNLYDQKQTFRQHPKNVFGEAISNDLNSKLMNNLQNLQNIWLSYFDNKVCRQLIKMKNLKRLAIGFNDFNSQNIRYLSEEIWSQLNKLKNLRSLAFIKIQINEKYLKEMIINNKESLQALYFYQCRNFTDSITACIKQANIQIKDLFIYRCGQFTGRTLWPLQSLTTLILRQIDSIDQKQAFNISRLSNLTHLSLMGSKWLQDNIMSQISKLKELTYLNIGMSKVSSVQRLSIQALKNLRCLHLGCTRVKGKFVLQICQQLQKLKKLSVYSLNGIDEKLGKGMITTLQLRSIGQKRPQITHLDIGGCSQLSDQLFSKNFKHLKFVNMWNCSNISQKIKSQLKKRGVQCFEDV